MPNYNTVGMIISEESLPTIIQSEEGIEKELERPSNTYVSLKKLAETSDQAFLEKQRKRFAGDSRNLQFLENTPQAAKNLCQGSDQGKIAESEVDPFLEFGASNEEMRHAAYGLHQQVGNNAFYSLPSLFQAQNREPKLSLNTAFCKIYDKENSIDVVEGPPKKIVKPYSGTIYNLAIENNPSEVMYLDSESQLQKCKVQDLAKIISVGKCLPIITVSANAEIKEPTSPNSDPEISVSYEYTYDSDLLKIKPNWQGLDNSIPKGLIEELAKMRIVLNEISSSSNLNSNESVLNAIAECQKVITNVENTIKETYLDSKNPPLDNTILHESAKNLLDASKQLKHKLEKETRHPVSQAFIDFRNWVKKNVLNIEVKPELRREDVRPAIVLGTSFSESKAQNDLSGKLKEIKERTGAAQQARTSIETSSHKSNTPKPGQEI